MDQDFGMQKMIEPLYRVKGWVKFAGVMSIIQGAFSVLTIWGIIVAWLPIWMGVLLCSASNKIRTAYETNNEDEFRSSMEKLGLYFRILGILGIAIIGLAVVGILIAMLLPALAAVREAANEAATR
jgi:hypothetical protein